MDNRTANKNQIPCQSWVGQNGWSTTSAQGPLLNPLPSSQHLSLGSSSEQRPTFNHLQASNQSCMSDLSTLSSRTHHPALYKASHISSSPSSNTLFANNALLSSSHSISFAQQNPHTSPMVLTANQGKNIPSPSLLQTNQAPQPCRPQQPPLVSPQDLYKSSFQPPLTSQRFPNRLQDVPISLSTFGQRVSTSQATFEGACVEFAGVAGYTHSHTSSTSQEQRQWIPSSHCRGAVNESVPDAAHPNQELPQEENVSQLANSEKQRLVILHQRAQLLQQVAELDKLLETIPQEDNSDGQSTHTVNQPQQVQLSTGKSKSYFSSDSLSPASYDNQNETCDTPEDPMSPAESVKKEYVSSEAGDDNDPDYLPHSDGEVSDFQSDHKDFSAAESSPNSPSTPTDKRPSVAEKKGAKSGSSSLKRKSVSPPKELRPIKPRKKVTETLVFPSSNTKSGRVYDKKNYCLFCSKPVSKMSRHLESIHSDKPEVAAAFQYPKHSRERQKLWKKLINQGNFAHNKEVMRTGKGQLIVRQRPKVPQKAHDFLHCLYCRGLFLRKSMSRHMSRCSEKEEKDTDPEIRRKRVTAQCVLETLGDLGLSDGLKSILSLMVYDDVTQAILEDEIILQLGELLFNQHGSERRKHDYIRQNLRYTARLVLEAQKTTPLQKLEDFFLPSNFPHVVSAVNVLAGYNPETKTYSIPSLAIKLGYQLQKACSIVEGKALKCGDEGQAESARNFISVYQKKWSKLISSGALSTLRETKRLTANKVPLVEDVKNLNFHLENIQPLAVQKFRESPSAESYAALTRLILAQTTLFNRRRAIEVSLMQLTDFMSRKKSSSLNGLDVSVTDLEKTMCPFFTRIDIKGKCGRMVPVILKPSFVSAMELFVKERETCGVSSKNLFIFARPYALSAYHGPECIQKYVKAVGAKDPETMTAGKIRKHYTTLLQLISLDENEAEQILGPNNQVRSLRQNSSMQLGDVEVGFDERGQAVSWDHNERSDAHYGPAGFYYEQAYGTMPGANLTTPPTAFISGKKGSQTQGKHKWEEAEVLAVERHLMHLIQEHKVPQKDDCVQCLEAEPEALRTRTWKGVKDYVRNRITALKRQSKAS